MDCFVYEVAGFGTEPLFFPSMHRGAAWEFSRGMFVDLRSDHGTAQMGRGVVHAIGYAVRQSIETLDQAGCDVTDLTACGGQARNAVWNQMKADITGLPVRCPAVLDAELIGNYCCALAGTGSHGSPVEAAESIVQIASVHDPDRENHRRYTEGYLHYLNAYDRYLAALQPVVEGD